MTKNTKTNLKTYGSSTIWSVLSQGLGQVLSLLIFMITARFVSKEAFGIMAASMLFIEFFKQVLMESLATLFYSKRSPTHDDYNAGFYLIFGCGIVAGLLLYIASPLVGGIFDNPEIADTLKWISLLLLTVGISKMHEIWLVKNYRFKELAIRSITSICIGGGIGIWMAINDYGIVALIVQQILTALISTVWLWQASEWKPTLDFKVQNFKEIIHYSKYYSSLSIGSFFAAQIDIFFASYYLGAAPTGVYNASKRLLFAITIVISSGLNAVALPALTDASEDEQSYIKSFIACNKLTILLTAPMFAGIAALSDDVITVLLGSDWIEAAPILSILTIHGFMRSFTQYSWNVLMIDRTVRLHSILIVAEVVSNLLLLFIFAPYGLNALALAFVGKSLIFSPIIIRSALQLRGIRAQSFIKIMLSPVVCTFIMYALIALLKAYTAFNPIINLIIYVPIGFVIYLGTLFLIDRHTLIETSKIIYKAFKKP